MAKLLYRSAQLYPCDHAIRYAVSGSSQARSYAATTAIRRARLPNQQAHAREFIHAQSSFGSSYATASPWTRQVPSYASVRYRTFDNIQGQRHLHVSRRLSQANRPTQSKTENLSKDSEAQQRVTQEPPEARLTERLVNARERTKDVTNKVKSSLANLTPHENIYNLPNLLTVSRLFAAPLTAYLLLHDQHGWALAVFAYAGFTDLVDGWMARKWKLQTVAGSVIDPMADKALMIIVTVTLAVKGAIPAYLATLILGRDASLAIAAIWYRYASLPAPKTLARYWDFSLPSAEVHPTTVSKYNTFLQLILIGSTLALPVVTADNHHLGILNNIGLGSLDVHQAMLGLQLLVAGTTAWSGLSYAFLKNAVTIIGSDEKLKARQGAIGRAIIGVSFGAIVLVAAYLGIGEVRKEKEETETQTIRQ